MGDIKPSKKITSPKKDEPVLKIKQIGDKHEPLKEYNEYASVPKELKPRNKTKRRIIFTIIILLIIWVVLYFFSSIQITIIPKKTVQNVNQLVNLTSWNSPIKTTIMSIDERVEVYDLQGITEAKIKLDEKIRGRLTYDMPKDYKMVGNCKSGIHYVDPIFTDKANEPKYLSASTHVLIFETKSLESYLAKLAQIDNTHVKDITKISCELKSDISGDSIKSTAVSFAISGDVVLLPDIDTNILNNQYIFKTQNFVKKSLTANNQVESYTLQTTPLAIFPILPKNPNRINFVVNE